MEGINGFNIGGVSGNAGSVESGDAFEKELNEALNTLLEEDN